MNCLKCGKETADPHVFCPGCMEAMESAPVKPGTAIHLPHRTEPQDKKGRRIPSQKEVLTSLRRLIRWLAATIAVLTVIICILAGILLRTIDQQNAANLIGKNYTTNTDANPQP